MFSVMKGDVTSCPVQKSGILCFPTPGGRSRSHLPASEPLQLQPSMEPSHPESCRQVDAAQYLWWTTWSPRRNDVITSGIFICLSLFCGILPHKVPSWRPSSQCIISTPSQILLPFAGRLVWFSKYSKQDNSLSSISMPHATLRYTPTTKLLTIWNSDLTGTLSFL